MQIQYLGGFSILRLTETKSIILDIIRERNKDFLLNQYYSVELTFSLKTTNKDNQDCRGLWK